MHFPYGLSDFSKLIEQDYWYLDRTDRIAQIEAVGDQLIFLRPRRFGKSLLLSMLEHYYDLNRAAQFETLFGTSGRGTQSRRRCTIGISCIKWDFSRIPAHGEIDDIEACRASAYQRPSWPASSRTTARTGPATSAIM
jgi:hypothetical protein